MPDGFSVERLGRRRSWLDAIEAEATPGRRRSRHQPQRSALGRRPQTAGGNDPMAEQRELAFSLLLSGKVARAFDIDREDPKVRDRYGRHMFGQSLLLARRLVQAGRADRPGEHGAGAELGHALGELQDAEEPAPAADRPGGLGPAGRPGGHTAARRDAGGHHRRVRPDPPDRHQHRQRQRQRRPRPLGPGRFSALFAGGGVRGGQAIGQSDRIGAYPASRPYTPADLAATIYRRSASTPPPSSSDRLNRPIRLCDGKPIAPLFG